MSKMSLMQLGMYSRQIIESNNLPCGWRATAVSPDGWTIAAESVGDRQIVILCRPDSVQSMRGDAGRRILRAALEKVSG